MVRLYFTITGSDSTLPRRFTAALVYANYAFFADSSIQPEDDYSQGASGYVLVSDERRHAVRNVLDQFGCTGVDEVAA